MNCGTRTRGKLCGREECKPCFERSFASCDKAKYLAEGQGNPLLLARCSTKKLKFDCPKCAHVFEANLANVSNGYFCPFCSNNKLCAFEECGLCFEKSFASHEKAKFWSFEKNKLTPRKVFMGSSIKHWFECGKCGHSFKTKLSHVSDGHFCPFCSNNKLCSSDECKTCFEKSFACHKKAEFWSFKKNKQSPRDVFSSSGKKFWFECEKCEHSFGATPANVSNGRFCPFCSNQKLCSSSDCETCFEKSFVSRKKAEFWSFEKNKQSPREVFASSNRKYWFECGKCEHSFEMRLNAVSKGCFCPFCSNPPKKLCSSPECNLCFEKSFASHEKAEFWDTEKNEQGPREVFSGSDKNIWFKCKKEHGFSSVLQHVSSGSWCPKCKNKSEAKLLYFLEKHFKDPIHQFKTSRCKNPETNKFLPFDFCVSKTIIELDGAQHYKQVMNWQSPELTQKSDRYKEEQAIKNGYSVLRVLQEDVWNDKIDWKSLLLEHIKDYETPIVKNLWEIIEEQKE
uniref:Restriction endonuclease n=1 Tax=Marseillevirus sp. TaxID=2809551 RepID=A0AA96EQG3_9VIRU|nr:restriction endonuclease [Marseillevirus sp.]